MFKYPKSDSKYLWTNHVGRKMYFYGLSADKVKRILRNPKRSEKGIAPKTVAVMQPAGTSKRPSEIWVMYAVSKKSRIPSETSGGSRGSNGKPLNRLGAIGREANRKIIITAWRYPGISPIRERVPIPNDILEELRNEKLI